MIDKKIRILVGIVVAIVASALLAQISLIDFSSKKEKNLFRAEQKTVEIEINEKLLKATLKQLSEEAKVPLVIYGMEWADNAKDIKTPEPKKVVEPKVIRDKKGNIIQKIEFLEGNKEKITYFQKGKEEKVEIREVNPKTKKAEGLATTTYSNGAKSEQHYKDGVLDGISTVWFANGDKEVSRYNDGKLTGESVYTFTNGDREELIYVDGVPEGKAAYIYANGVREEYIYINGKRVD